MMSNNAPLPDPRSRERGRIILAARNDVLFLFVLPIYLVASVEIILRRLTSTIPAPYLCPVP